MRTPHAASHQGYTDDGALIAWPQVLPDEDQDRGRAWVDLTPKGDQS